MIKGIQIIGMTVGCYLLLQTFLNFKKGNYGIKRTFLMTSIWLLMIILFYNPSLTYLLLPILSTQDTIMSILVLGILGSYILIANMYQGLSSIDKKLTDLVQNIAVENYIRSYSIHEEDVKRDDKKKPWYLYLHITKKNL